MTTVRTMVLALVFVGAVHGGAQAVPYTVDVTAQEEVTLAEQADRRAVMDLIRERKTARESGGPR